MQARLFPIKSIPHKFLPFQYPHAKIFKSKKARKQSYFHRISFSHQSLVFNHRSIEGCDKDCALRDMGPSAHHVPESCRLPMPGLSVYCHEPEPRLPPTPLLAPVHREPPEPCDERLPGSKGWRVPRSLLVSLPPREEPPYTDAPW